MNVNIIRLKQTLHDNAEKLTLDDTDFLEEINNNLIDDDLIIKENANNAVMDVIFIETGGTESQFVKLFPKLTTPILLLCTGLNNSLPAALEIKTYCALHGKEGYIMTGSESQCAGEIKHFARVKNAQNLLSGQRLGIIGKPSDWLIASQIDKKTVKEYFDIDLIDIDINELFKEIDKQDLISYPTSEIGEVKGKIKKSLPGAMAIYTALKNLVNVYQLDGLTIRCFDLLDKYHNTACLALGLLNQEGIVAACEGDVFSLLTMAMIKALTGRSAFQGNPSFIDTEKTALLIAHCTIPLNMVSSYTLTTHFESGLGIGIKGSMPLDRVSVCKLFLKDERLVDHSFLATGKIISNPHKEGYCRTQILVKLDQYSLFTLYQKNFGNHLVVTYADCEDDFYTLISLYEKNYFMRKHSKKDDESKVYEPH